MITWLRQHSLFLVGVPAVLGATYVLLRPALWLVVGFVIAAIVIWWGPGIKPLLDLGRATLPLGFPIVLFTLIVLLSFSVAIQALVATIAGLITFGFFAGSVGAQARTKSLKLLLLILPTCACVAVGVIGLFYAWNSWRHPDALDHVGRFGGAEASMLYLAIGLFVVAVVLRIAGFATSGFRKGFVAVAMLAFARYALILAGPDTWAKFLSRSWWDYATISGLLLAFILVLIAESAVAEAAISSPQMMVQSIAAKEAITKAATPEAIDPDSAPARLGRLAAFAAAGALLVSLLIGLIDIGWHNYHFGLATPIRHGPRPARIAYPTPAEVASAFRDNHAFAKVTTFADDYLPFLEFDPEERWVPSSVDEFVSDAKLTSSFAKTQTIESSRDINHLGCPYGSTVPCYTLFMSCRKDAACKRKGLCIDSENPCALGKGTNQPIVMYVRVVARGEPNFANPANPAERRIKLTDDSPPVFTHPTPFGKRLKYLIQYWLFYAFDEWSRTTPAGIVTQSHQGDWEVVTVGLGQAQPLFLALSQHCGGDWYSWDSLPDHALFEDQPVIAVAKGSHANYIDAHAVRASDWGSCKSHSRFASVMSFISNARDTTGTALPQRRSHKELVNANAFPMNFPGYWGGFTRIQLKTLARTRSSYVNHGIATPVFQSPWQNPLGTIFCSKLWHHESHDNLRRTKC